jgi:FAD/FMN-containing dehydrogenase
MLSFLVRAAAAATVFGFARAEKNQCGNVAWNPSSVVHPTSDAGVAAAIQNAISTGKTVKVIGDKHSFSPLDVTSGVEMLLDQYAGQPLVVRFQT